MNIITDQSTLRQVSEPVAIDDKSVDETINALIENIPDNGVGLAAPQIDIFKRIFITKMNGVITAFINPELSEASSNTFPSIEGCLSIPDTQCCVNRHQTITISSPLVKIFQEKQIETIRDYVSRVKGFESAVIQHEYDHLEGVLMIDHRQIDPNTLINERKNKRRRRIQAQRAARSIWEEQQNRKKQKKQKANPKRAKKAQQLSKSFEKRQRKCVEVQERAMMEESGLLKSDDDKS